MKKLVEDEIKNENLWKAMGGKGIKTAKQLAINLISEKIYTDFRRKPRNTDEEYSAEEIKKLNINTLSKAISKFLYENECSNMNLLVACCKYFQCSADYLLGFISSPTHEISQIHDVTGLSQEAVTKIIEWYNDLGSETLNSSIWVDFISEMILNENAEKFLSELQRTIKDNYSDNDFLTQASFIFDERQIRNYRNTYNGNMYELSQIYNQIITKVIADNSKKLN